MMPPSEPMADDTHASGATRIDPWLCAIAAVAVVAGVLLRFLPRSGLWLDEALTANISALPLGRIGDALRVDGHPPLYYWLAHLWGRISQDDTWLRSLSAVIGVLSLPLLYLGGCRIARRVGGDELGARRVGLVALTIGAVLPYGVRYGSELRMYSLVITLTAAGYLLVDDLLEARRSGRARVLTAGGVALLAAALLWSHYWSVWLLAAVGLLAMWRSWKEPDDDRRSGARWLVASLVVGGLAFLPWVPTMLFQAANTGTPWGERFLPASVVVVTLVDFAGGRFGAAQLLSYLLVVAALLALMVRIGRDATLVIDARPQPRVRAEVVVVGVAMALGSLAAIASSNTFASRYAAIVFALVVLVVATGVCVLRSQVATAATLAAIVALSLYGAVGEARSSRSQSGVVADAVVSDLSDRLERGAVAGGDDVVVISCPDQLAVSLQRELDRQDRRVALVDVEDVVPYPLAGEPRFVDWVDYADRNAAASPEDFVGRISERLGDDVTIYLYSNAQYLTVETACDRLVDALAPGRPVEQLVVGNPEQFYEFGDLRVLGPRS